MIIQELVAQFNPHMSDYLTPGDISVMKTQATQTYAVDSKGEINFPVIGKVKIGGLTKSEAIDLLHEKVSAHLTDPTIYIQVFSFKITVLGEVRNPGVKAVPEDRISILDAIGAAQDLTIYGDRKNVLLIRDNDGEKEYAQFDLTQSDIFSSPYFYLQQNDVIIVNPNPTRVRESTYGASKSYRLSTYSAIISSLSALSTVALVIYNIRNKN
jgi:polysaccharide export outer membrane protein